MGRKKKQNKDDYVHDCPSQTLRNLVSFPTSSMTRCCCGFYLYFTVLFLFSPFSNVMNEDVVFSIFQQH